MGKGDPKTKRGKVFKKSSGKYRSKKSNKNIAILKKEDVKILESVKEAKEIIEENQIPEKNIADKKLAKTTTKKKTESESSEIAEKPVVKKSSNPKSTSKKAASKDTEKE